jgi:hypothetical protein
MADDDARANVLKSLGISRRRSGEDGGAGEAAEAEPPAVPAEPPVVTAVTDAIEGGAAPVVAPPAVDAALGVRRRSGAAAAAPVKDKDEAKSADATIPDAKDGAKNGDAGDARAAALGIKRRKSGAVAAADEAALEAAAPAEERPKYGNDQAAIMLSNYFKGRPAMLEHFPPRAFELKRTHGFYNGDGRADRKIFVGFEPALVLFVIPVYPEAIYPTYEKGDWHHPIDPGLHRQPRFEKDGFVVDEAYNTLGDGYVYVVFKSDGEPLVAAPVEETKAPERPKAGGLGIRRRK